MKKIFQLIFSIFTFLLFLAFPSQNASAEVIKDYLIDITVQEDASINVQEKIHYDFENETRRGIIREIPIQYGKNLELQSLVTVHSIKDDRGNEYNYTKTIYNDLMSIRIGDADVFLTGDHWYYINYSITPAVMRYESHDELYWNAIGAFWDVAIKNAEISVKLPEEVVSNFDVMTKCYGGPVYSEAETCKIEKISETEYRYSSNEEIPPFEGLTILTGFKSGILNIPTFVNLHITPSSSEIAIDGDYISTYGSSVFALSPGTHQLEIKKNLYIPVNETINVAPGPQIVLNYELKPIFLLHFLRVYLPLILFFGGIYLIFMMWKKYGKDAEGHGVIAPTFIPPAELSPSEAGVLIDEKAHMRDISAAIISLAVKGLLKINRKEEKGLLLKSEKFEFIKIPDSDKKLTECSEIEKDIYKELFVSGKPVVALDDLKNKFYTHLPKLKKRLYDSLVEKNIFAKNPEEIRILYRVLGAVLLVALFVVGIFIDGILETEMYFPLFFLLGIIFFLTAGYMPKRTAKGKKLYEEILGLKMYIKTAEVERLKFLNSPQTFRENFEKLLPYALIMSLEKEWFKTFQKMFEKAPEWFSGGGFTDFSKSIYNFTSKSQTVMKSTPPSQSSGYSGWSSGSGSSWSGGSGFSSGGGFSGGGFGGGGGSSW